MASIMDLSSTCPDTVQEEANRMISELKYPDVDSFVHFSTLPLDVDVLILFKLIDTQVYKIADYTK